MASVPVMTAETVAVSSIVMGAALLTTITMIAAPATKAARRIRNRPKSHTTLGVPQIIILFSDHWELYENQNQHQHHPGIATLVKKQHILENLYHTLWNLHT